jgi:FMN reductase
MKAQVVQSFVFIEAKDIHRGQIVSDDVSLRIERLVEDTVVLTQTYSQMRSAREIAYAF